MEQVQLSRPVLAKLKRARALIGELDRLLHEWGEKCFIHKLDYNEEQTHYQLKLELKSEPPIDECCTVLGDLFHNLRSALDLWMSEKADATGPEAKGLRLQYPIAKTGKEFRNWRSNVRDLVDERLIDAIREYQPYREKLPGIHYLQGISDLDNADKHRTMLSIDFSHDSAASTRYSPVTPTSERPQIKYEAYLVSAITGGVVVDIWSDVPVDIEIPTVSMQAYFELDGKKHELVQNIRGLHMSVYLMLIGIERKVAASASGDGDQRSDTQGEADRDDNRTEGRARVR